MKEPIHGSWISNRDLEALHDRISAAEKERDYLADRVKDLQYALRECADDLECEVQHNYCDADGELIHPAYEVKYERDMEPINAARALLEEAPDAE